MSLESIKSKIVKLIEGRKFEFKSQDWIFVRVLTKFKNSVVYEIEEKDIPIYIIPDELYEEYYKHSPVLRLTKLTNDEKVYKNLTKKK